MSADTLLWQQWLLPCKKLRGCHAMCGHHSTTIQGNTINMHYDSAAIIAA
jgi:hypothetical protein